MNVGRREGQNIRNAMNKTAKHRKEGNRTLTAEQVEKGGSEVRNKEEVRSHKTRRIGDNAPELACPPTSTGRSSANVAAVRRPPPRRM